MRRLLDLLLTVAVLGLLALVAARGFGPAQTANGIARVSDGDSLVVTRLRIRLEGIDAPELRQSCLRADGAEWPCGRHARDALLRFAGGGAVMCEGWSRDRYDRLLARCTVAGLDLARAMVEEGWAVAYGGYDAAEAEARRARRGLWAGSFELPQDWRRIHGGMAEDRHDDLLAWLRGIWHGWTADNQD